MAWDGASMCRAEAEADADTAHVAADAPAADDADDEEQEVASCLISNSRRPRAIGRPPLALVLAPTAWDGTRNAGGAFVMLRPSVPSAVRSRMRRQQATADTRCAGREQWRDTRSITPPTWSARRSRNWDGVSSATVHRRPVVGDEMTNEYCRMTKQRSCVGIRDQIEKWSRFTTA